MAARLTSIRTLAMVPAPPVATQADSSPISAPADDWSRGRPASLATQLLTAVLDQRGRKRRSRRLLNTTSSELADMAIPANSGLT